MNIFGLSPQWIIDLNDKDHRRITSTGPSLWTEIKISLHREKSAIFVFAIF
jgi:hypothetical protein